jgi:hypothetical protein
MLLGTYYEPDGKVMKDASLGLAAWNLNTAVRSFQRSTMHGMVPLVNTCLQTLKEK